LAFQRLAFVTRYSAGARKQVFALGQNGIGTSAIKWNTVADQCLFQIADLTEKLGYYQRHCSCKLLLSAIFLWLNCFFMTRCLLLTTFKSHANCQLAKSVDWIEQEKAIIIGRCESVHGDIVKRIFDMEE